MTIPAGCMITLNTAALHRNPRYWPHTSEEDLDEFRPERWLLDPMKTSANADENAYAEEEGLDFDGPDKRPGKKSLGIIPIQQTASHMFMRPTEH